MHSQLETYLQDTDRYLKNLPPQVREAELGEIASHLHQLTADLIAEGYTEDEAAKIAIDRFGSPGTIGLRIRDVWEGNQPLLKTLFVVIGSNWALQLFYMIANVCLVFLLPLKNEKLMATLAPLLMLYSFFALILPPMAWSFLLGRWGGRCVVPATFVAFFPWILMSIGVGPSAYSLLWMGVLGIVLPLTGAWAGSTQKRRQRLVVASGDSQNQSAK